MNRSRVQRARVEDALLAAGLLVVALVELLSGGPHEWWRYAAAAGGTLPLAARRRAPMGVLLVLVAALSVPTLRGDDTFPVGQLVALMIAMYTVAAACSARAAGAGLALTITAAFVNSAVAGSKEPGDYAFAVILLGAPWLAGLGVRRWRLQAEEMRDLVRQLETERAEHSRLAIAAERGRIARDLHDSMAQALNAVVVHAEAAEEALGRDGERVRRSLGRIQDVGRSSLAETRQLLRVLRTPGAGASTSLRLADLDALVESYVAEGLEVELRRTGADHASPTAEATVYRIVQESLTNVLRHSRGSRVCVSVEVGSDVLVDVRDDGTGSESAREHPGTGYGLIGMRERVELLGGTLRAAPERGGFVVRAMLPNGTQR